MRWWLAILLLRYTKQAPPASLFFDSSDDACTPPTTGTDVLQQDKSAGPTNDLDRLCRQHDIQISQLGEEADKRFLQSAPKHGWLCNFFAGLNAAKNNLRGLPRSEYLPGEGAPPPPQRAVWRQMVQKNLRKHFGSMTQHLCSTTWRDNSIRIYSECKMYSYSTQQLI
ncbi:hypothetical protein CDAR_17581 [Caerostris darwini]|uniref:Uncharacterized protein n=1 Tax=Caerostris darwini TaxID=1538125 RepID=A0AAV4NCQ2_9ARAC|nr:hypothetical protein CDAR_17581 [Caerostris darwini]